MVPSLVTIELGDTIAVIRLNRRDKLNALSGGLINDLENALKNVDGRANLRAVILTSADEGAFSAGTDISELTGLDKAPANEVSHRGQALCDQIANFRVPVIAAIDGVAAGGGCELALACHMRVASTRAMFSMPETKIGMIPAYGGTQRLGRIIGSGRALDMILSGRTMSAEEAFRVGLVNRVVEPGDLLNETESLAKEISKLAPLAIRACLEAVTRGVDLPIDEGLAIEAELFSNLFATDDVREGTSAFLEKREPEFKGQ